MRAGSKWDFQLWLWETSPCCCATPLWVGFCRYRGFWPRHAKAQTNWCCTYSKRNGFLPAARQPLYSRNSWQITARAHKAPSAWNIQSGPVPGIKEAHHGLLQEKQGKTQVHATKSAVQTPQVDRKSVE